MATKKKEFEHLGFVNKAFGNNNFIVDIETNQGLRSVPCYLSGKMRQFFITIQEGDCVRIELPPPFDRGRITYREKK